MTALKHTRKLIEDNPRSEGAVTLADLVIALESEAPFTLERLYALKLDEFELAVELLGEWRLARYYAKKGKLLDLAVQTRDLSAH
ncbi:hypothetical protein LJR039_007582 [Pseudorhodoferax sp. LjRoot39]|uniref:hypothetical protein n=1 Tax=Pseudorhodoferax sp. LjRoot39 TaxID=3342328 RepID=UPI003ECE7580